MKGTCWEGHDEGREGRGWLDLLVLHTDCAKIYNWCRGRAWGPPPTQILILIYTTNICIRIAIVIEYLIYYPTKYRGTERTAALFDILYAGESVTWRGIRQYIKYCSSRQSYRQVRSETRCSPGAGDWWTTSQVCTANCGGAVILMIRLNVR